MTLVVWWTTQRECEAIGNTLPASVPSYIADEYRSRLGRAGRGRLWVAPHLMDQSPSVTWGVSPMFHHLGECGGVVVSEEDKHTLASLPGVITDLKGERV